MYTFLAALDLSYETVRAQVLLSTEKLIFDAVTTLIRQETIRWVAMGPSVSNPKSKAQAFAIQCSNTGKGKTKREVERCAHCKKKGTHSINVGYCISISDLGIMIATREAACKKRKP
jgi:hypothetical protein